MNQANRLRPRTFVSRRWLPGTLLVLVGVAVLVRLGVWQLDRLEQRKAEVARLEMVLAEPPISLNNEDPLAGVEEPEYQQASVQGVYDLAEQVRVTQRRFRGQSGMWLITPLLIEGQETAILVNRGWIPTSDQGFEAWPDFPESRQVSVTGYLRPGERLPNGRQAPLPDAPKTEWLRVDIPGIQAQMPYPLLPFYLQALPETEESALGIGEPPYREEPLFDLSNGPHLSYAIQWFIFSFILAGGYIYLVWKQESIQSHQ